MSVSLHDLDFYAWTQQQAKLLKAGKLNEVDCSCLIEELESMGASERRQLINRLAVLLAHLLKWRHQPTFRGRSWTLTIKEQRRQLERHLRDNPSLARKFSEFVTDAYGDSVLLAARETGLEEDVFPRTCPYSESEILDPEFLPD
jgi:hypothetical protein